MKLNWERRIIVYHNICPKCHSKEILKIKDVFHSSGGGNISHARHIFNEKNCISVKTVDMLNNIWIKRS